MADITYSWTTTEPYTSDNKVVKWGLSYTATQDSTTSSINEIVDVPEEDQKPLADWTTTEINDFREAVKANRDWEVSLQGQVGGGLLVDNWDSASLSIVEPPTSTE